MIVGVKTKKLKVIPDERGRLMEMFRCDDEFFEKYNYTEPDEYRVEPRSSEVLHDWSRKDS